jgi:ATP-dependent DNA helicase RecG
VVPLIVPDDSGDDGTGVEADEVDEIVIETSAVAAEAEAVRLRELLAPLRVGLVHGRVRPADRDAEMARFRDGELDVLVGTTVVEVGVDVPEATMMVIEGAERFGLAQLHQLRGRVGRGRQESFCVLVSDRAESTRDWKSLVRGSLAPTSTEQARLIAVARIQDGFELAERDWELRREGNVLGLVQSGLPELRVASLQREGHRELAVRAREVAETLLDGAGRLRPGHGALEAELRAGWLGGVARAEPGAAA